MGTLQSVFSLRVKNEKFEKDFNKFNKVMKLDWLVMLNRIKTLNILAQNNNLLFPKPAFNTKIKVFFV